MEEIYMYLHEKITKMYWINENMSQSNTYNKVTNVKM